MAKYKEGICPICGCEEETFVSAYRSHPFIDGRCYSEMCWTCANVPKNWEILPHYDDGFCVHDNYLMVYNTFNSNRLFTAKEMMEEGFNKEEAERSIKAVKRAIKQGKPHIDLIRHAVTLPAGYGTTPPPPNTINKPEEDMSRRKKRRNRRNNQQQPRKEKQSRKPLLVEQITIREKTDKVAW